MMKKFLPLLPLVVVCLFACGAAEQTSSVDEVITETVDVAIVANPQQVQRGEVFRPIGTGKLAGVSTPETAPADWRLVAPDQVIFLKTTHGTTLIELASDFAPGHTSQYGGLAHDGYFKGMPFHRVIEGFMAQAGDHRLVGRPEPSTPTLAAEFTYRRAPATKMIVVGERRSAQAGFINGFKFASQNPALASMTVDGKVEAWQLHCPGAVAAARLGNDINSANAQFYITTAYPENLDKGYTIWGRVRAGLTPVYQIKKGEPVIPPDLIEEFALTSDMDPSIRPSVWVMDTNGAAFITYLEGLKAASGRLPDICRIEVPVFVRWPSE